MHSSKKHAPIQNESTSGAGLLAESGVRAIPPEAREALKALHAKGQHAQGQTPPGQTPQGQTEMPEEQYPRAVRNSADQVCPKMLEAHLTLVHQVVAPIARRVPANVLRDDLFAAGVFGLVDSLRKNGGDGGTTFEWYARTRIRGAVLDELRAQDWLTRRARDSVNAAAQREDGESEGAVLVGLDELSAVDEEEFLVSSKLDPAAAYEAKETYQILALALDKLPERERKVIGMSYFKEKKYKEIGAELCVSEPRVCQLHARALERLKGAFAAKRFRRAMLPEVCPDAPESEASRDDWDDELPVNDPSPDVA